MKTWWDYYPVMILAVAGPLLAGAAPTFVVGSNPVGGGVIRQFGINQVAELLPLPVGQAYVDAFMGAGYGGEVLLFLPVAVNVAAMLAMLVYVAFSAVIRVGNWMKRSEFDSQRKASKGA